MDIDDLKPDVDIHPLRKMYAELNVLSMADGSAMYCQGNTCITAAVYGPIEAKVQKVQVDKAIVDISYKAKGGPPEIADKMNEFIVKNTCETAILTSVYPRTAINVAIQEMQNDGALLASIINASCVALINAAIPLQCLFAAVNCVIDSNGQITLDAAIDTRESVANLTFVFDSIEKNVIASHTFGKFSDEQYLAALFKCRSACDKIMEFYRSLVTRYADKIGKRHA